MARVLVTEKIADSGLDILRLAGHEVDLQLELGIDDFKAKIQNAEGEGTSIMVLATDVPVHAEVLEDSRSRSGIKEVYDLDLR
mgnify:CR=1 FL=1|tara:strand:- start:778 stop:1026 length:249 start_codon:yes stop_codon:yes gene_type:complete